MPVLDRAGRFIVRAFDWSVGRKDNGPVCFWFDANITREWKNAEWVDVTPYALTVSGTAYLTKKDGTINEHAVKRLRAALGWKGGFSELQNTDWTSVDFQVTCEFEEYKGKSYLKVKWINHKDDQPKGVAKLEKDVLAELDKKYGAGLAAVGTDLSLDEDDIPF